MKKSLLVLIGAFSIQSLSAQVTDVVNGDFESWIPNTYTLLDSLTDQLEERINSNQYSDSIAVVKSTDVQVGNYSVLLKTMKTELNDTAYGYFINGKWGDNGPSGGEAFTLDADSLRGYWKYNIMPGDTAWIILQLKGAGNVIAGGQYPITGSQNSWSTFSLPTNYLVGSIDTIFFAATSSNVIGDSEKAFPGSWLMLDDIYLTKNLGGEATFSNADFESWSDTIVYDIQDWYTIDYTLERSTYAHGGSYAAQLMVEEVTHGDGSKDTVGAFITNYDFNNNNSGGTAYISDPTKIEWYWDYNPSGIDTGYIYVDFLKNGSSIGVYYQQVTTSTGGFVYNSIDITLPSAPDTFKIAFNCGEKVGTKMYIDDIQLFSNPTGVDHLKESGLTLFPNPATNFLNGFSASTGYRIVDSSGRVVQSGNVSVQGTVEVSNLKSGVYKILVEGESPNSYSFVKE